MRASSGIGLSVIALTALLGGSLYLLGCQTVAWVNAGHGDIVTLLDGMNSLNVLDFRSSKVPMGDWPLWLVLLIPSAYFVELCRERVRAAREFRKLEDELFRRDMRSYRRKGSIAAG